jgi:hypothetical protein
VATRYVVLEKKDLPVASDPTKGHTSAWVEIGREKAHNGRQAISLCLLAENTSVAPEYKAVPERNWKSEFPGIKQEQRVVFGKSMAEADAE